MSRPPATSARLLISLVPWAIVGGALIYLSPAIAHLILQSDLTATWLQTLSRSGYYPKEAAIVAGLSTIVGIILTLQGNGQRRTP
jgi:hypothetical protein